MKNKPSTSILALAGVSVALAAAPAGAQVLYADSFSSPNGTAAAARTPDVTEAPAFAGNIYGFTGYAGYGSGSYSTVQNGVQLLGADYGLGLPFGSSPSFASLNASVLQLSLNFSFLNLQNGDNSSQRGIGLGFYSAMTPGAAHGDQGFYGIVVDNNGNVKLYDNLETLTYYASANVGALSTTATETLSYDVNTISGAVSGIILEGSPVTLNFGANANNVFTGSVLNNVGFMANESYYMDTGSVDNFAVSAVPEPGSIALGLAGAVGLIAFKRKS